MLEKTRPQPDHAKHGPLAGNRRNTDTTVLKTQPNLRKKNSVNQAILQKRRKTRPNNTIITLLTGAKI
jgi:hypothetical protein